MGNGIVRGVRPPFNPIQNIQQIKAQYQNLKNNPQGIADYLKKSGRFTDEQINTISGMNGNVSQIGQYLMGSAPQNMMGQIQNGVNTIQKQI